MTLQPHTSQDSNHAGIKNRAVPPSPKLCSKSCVKMAFDMGRERREELPGGCQRDIASHPLGDASDNTKVGSKFHP